MEGSSLDRLLEAEGTARRRIEKARDEAKRIVIDANEIARKERAASIDRFMRTREEKLKEAHRKASEEAERIRRDGVELAKGLTGRVKERVLTAADSVVSIYLD
jgi:vacuolar-type H+-ATPase subunit H